MEPLENSRPEVAARVARVIADGDGIITAGQAMECGLTRDQIRSRVTRGVWWRVARGVYLAADHHLTESARLRVAAHQFRAVVDRTAAAWWHGMLEDLDPVVTLSCPRSVKPRRKGRAFCRVDVVSRDLCPVDVEILRGLPVTKQPLSTLLAASWLEAEAVRRDGRSDGAGATLLDRALQTHRVTIGGLRAAAERNAGLHGMPVARSLLAVASSGSESAAERLFVTLLRAEAVGGWVQQFPFGRWTIDFAWCAEKVAVEINGWAFHSDPRRQDSDARKTSALATAGWITLVFTWHQLRYEPEACIERLAAALSQRRVRFA